MNVSVVIVIFFVIVVVVWTKMRTTSSRRASSGKKLNVPAIFINLDRRPDRLKHCLAQLRPQFETLQRHSAIDGRYVDTIRETRLSPFYDLAENKRWDQNIRMLHTRRMSYGEIGCCISHRNVWELALGRNLPMVAIFEDDVLVHNRNFKTRVRNALNALPHDWDVLYLGYMNTNGIGESVKGTDSLRKVTFLFGAYAYIVRNKGLKILAGQLPIDRPIDNFLGMLTETGVLTAYAVFPPVAEQIEYGGLGSDIVHTAHIG